MSDFITIDPSDMRTIERSQAAADRFQRGGYLNALFDDVRDRALDGQVYKSDVPFPYKGGLIMLSAGCFGDIRNRRVGFRIDHEESMEVASTDDALTLAMDDEGLQFRVDLSKCKKGSIIARMCEVDNRAAMSVGCDILKEHNETIDGRSVRVVTRARLTEVSICKDGAAGENAFAMVVDKTVTPKPVAGSRSATFHAGRMLHQVSRSVRKLKASIAATYDAPARVSPPQWSMTIEQSNKWQTVETERLQDYARQMHCR